MLFTLFQSPIGKIKICGTENHITQLEFSEDTKPKDLSNKSWALGELAIKQLQEYFEGKRIQFDLPIKLVGSKFQELVCTELINIPYGTCCSYKDIALAINKPKAARAIGQANNHNPILILVPCHRVISSNKQLSGYAGGIEKKKYLIELERSFK